MPRPEGLRVASGGQFGPRSRLGAVVGGGAVEIGRDEVTRRADGHGGLDGAEDPPGGSAIVDPGRLSGSSACVAVVASSPSFTTAPATTRRPRATETHRGRPPRTPPRPVGYRTAGSLLAKGSAHSTPNANLDAAPDARAGPPTSSAPVHTAPAGGSALEAAWSPSRTPIAILVDSARRHGRRRHAPTGDPRQRWLGRCVPIAPGRRPPGQGVVVRLSRRGRAGWPRGQPPPGSRRRSWCTRAGCGGQRSWARCRAARRWPRW